MQRRPMWWHREHGRSRKPEPSTWAMMIIGFAGIVAAAARRRRKDEKLQLPLGISDLNLRWSIVVVSYDASRNLHRSQR